MFNKYQSKGRDSQYIHQCGKCLSSSDFSVSIYGVEDFIRCPIEFPIRKSYTTHGANECLCCISVMHVLQACGSLVLQPCGTLVVFWFCLFLVSTAQAASPSLYKTGFFVIQVEALPKNQWAVSVLHNSSDSVLWRNIPGRPFVSTGIGVEAFQHQPQGNFIVTDTTLLECFDQTIDDIVTINQGAQTIIEFRGHFADLLCPNLNYSFQFYAIQENQLKFSLQVRGPKVMNRAYLNYFTEASEQIFGLGAQYSYWNMKGRVVPIITREQGIGRGLEPITTILNTFGAGAGGNPLTTYSAIPHYITSNIRSLFLFNTEYIEFDLSNAEEIGIKVFSPQIEGCILHGKTPLDLVFEYTSFSGRMDPLPAWLNEGAVVGIEGGTDQVLGVLKKLQNYSVPIAAFWAQDWVGVRIQRVAGQNQTRLWWNWEVDETEYPKWEQLLAYLNTFNIRMMTYINPFLTDVSKKPHYQKNYFQIAAANGYLVKTTDGKPYLIDSGPGFSAGLIDLTNPAARTFYKNIIKTNMLNANSRVYGWMADFGEYVPFDNIVLSSGISPLTFHNMYPQEWARLNYEAVDEMKLQGQVAFFCRSLSPQSPNVSTLFWLGDQLLSWDGFDGLQTVVNGLLSTGISGFSLSHSDTGGYTNVQFEQDNITVIDYRRSKELLLRWTELSAFTTVLRTHPGSAPENNYQVFSDDETLRHFSKFATVYKSLSTYRQLLMKQAQQFGYPLVRSLFFHYPQDAKAITISNQFMLGSELIVAPVFSPNTSSVTVYLPSGQWQYFWSTKQYSGPNSFQIEAPIGVPAVFCHVPIDPSLRCPYS